MYADHIDMLSKNCGMMYSQLIGFCLCLIFRSREAQLLSECITATSTNNALLFPKIPMISPLPPESLRPQFLSEHPRRPGSGRGRGRGRGRGGCRPMYFIPFRGFFWSWFPVEELPRLIRAKLMHEPVLSPLNLEMKLRSRVIQPSSANPQLGLRSPIYQEVPVSLLLKHPAGPSLLFLPQCLS